MKISGKNILVTGGAGFIGSHLVDMLLKQDVAKVIVLDNSVRGGRHNLQKALKDRRLEFFKTKSDITCLKTVEKAVKDVDCVFHLASLSLPYCQENPRFAIDVNVMGTYNLLEACAMNNVKRVIFASSSSVYGNAVYSPMDENHPLQFRDIYAATKLSGETLFRAFYFKYGIEYVALRFMNIYGPRLDYEGAYVAIIMKLIDRLTNGLAPIIYGDGSQAFDFVFVEDACRSLILAMESALKCNTYNISSGNQISILKLCKTIQKIMDINIPIEFEIRESDGYLVSNRIGSTDKAKNELGFSVKVPLSDGLRKVIDWRNQHSKSFD